MAIVGAQFSLLGTENSSGGSTNVGSPQGVNYPSTVNSGDFLLLHVSNSGGITFDTPSGWTAIGVQRNGARLWYKIADGTETGAVSVTWPSGSARFTGRMSSFTNVDPLNPIDVSNSAASHTVTTITPSTANTLWVWCAGDLTAASYAPTVYSAYAMTTNNPTPWTPQFEQGSTNSVSQNAYIGMATSAIRSQTTASGNCTVTSSVETNPSGFVFALKSDTGERYWVGGTASWDGTASTKWAQTSGGSGGYPIPTPTLDVFLDANSGANTVTIATTTAKCKNLTCTGFTGTLAGSTAIDIYGALTIGSGMTFTNTGLKTFKGTSSYAITSNGKTITGAVTINSSGTFTMPDAFTTGGDFLINGGASVTPSNTVTITGLFTLTQGTFNSNNKNITVQGFFSSGSSTRTLLMGTGTWTINGNPTGFDLWDTTTTTNMTLTPSTSTIKLTGTLTADRNFKGGSNTFYTYWNATTGNFFIVMSGSNTFNTLKFDPGRKNQFTAGTTTHFTTLNATGTAGNLITMKSTSNGSAFTLSSDIAQIISCDYLSLQDSSAVYT